MTTTCKYFCPHRPSTPQKTCEIHKIPPPQKTKKEKRKSKAKTRGKYEFLVVDKKPEAGFHGQKFSSYSQIEKHTNEFSFNYLEHSRPTLLQFGFVCLFVWPVWGMKLAPKLFGAGPKKKDEQEAKGRAR